MSENELPVIGEWGWKYRHSGIPTDKKRPDHGYLLESKFYVSVFCTTITMVEHDGAPNEHIENEK